MADVLVDIVCMGRKKVVKLSIKKDMTVSSEVDYVVRYRNPNEKRPIWASG